jgi:hypothetical protein
MLVQPPLVSSCTEFEHVSKQNLSSTVLRKQGYICNKDVCYTCADSSKDVYDETIVSSSYSRSLGRVSVSKVHPLLLMKAVIRP